MNNLTFKQELTVTEELAKGFAIYLGWKEKLTRQITVVDDDTTDPVTTHFADEEYDNPETFIQFVDRKGKENTLNFYKPYSDLVVAQELEKTGIPQQIQHVEQEAQTVLENAKTEIENAVVKPIMDSLTSEVV
jgi:hypothetical protein